MKRRGAEDAENNKFFFVDFVNFVPFVFNP
jgi:hypothetical protein